MPRSISRGIIACIDDVAKAADRACWAVPGAARDAVSSLSDLWDEEQEEECDTGKAEVVRLAGEIELRGVHFAYAGSASRSLDGLDLHVPAAFHRLAQGQPA